MDEYLKSECIAYGLACGVSFTPTVEHRYADDERRARKARWERRKSQRGSR